MVVILIILSVIAVISLYPLLVSASSLDKAAERLNNKNHKPIVRSFMIGEYLYKVKYK